LGGLFFDVLLLLFFLQFFPKHATSLAELGANMVPTWAKMEAKIDPNTIQKPKS